MEGRYLTIGGVRMHYMVGGEGPPLVLLPGLASSIRASWDKLLPHLTERFRVYAVDLPGQGDSEKPTRRYTFEYGVEAIEGFLDALRLEAAHLAGSSAGGIVALATALRHPERVLRLVLIDSAGFGREVNFGLRLLSLPIIGELVTSPRRWLIKLSLRQNVSDPSYISDDVLDEFCRVRQQPGAKEAVLSVLRHSLTLRGMRPHLVLKNQLHLLQAPTLIIWGAKDKVIPVAHAHIGHRLIPNAKLHIFKDAGHDPVTERPLEVARLVSEFLL